MKDEKIAMIGTGMMGMSLAVLFTGNGYDTTVLATKEASVLRGRNSYNEMYSVLPRYTSVGLFEHQDAAGLDMVQNIENYLFPSLCDRKTAFDSVNDRVASHSRGQKDGMGIYKWDAESIADFKARASEPYWKYFNWNFPKD